MTKIKRHLSRGASAPRKLSPRQIRALDLILSGATSQETATALKVSRQTISEWKHQDPIFTAKLEMLRSEAEYELRYSAPMTAAFMLGQLRGLAAEGPHEGRLKAIQFCLSELLPRLNSVVPSSTPGLTDADLLILEVMQKRGRSGWSGIPTATPDEDARQVGDHK